jgi:serine protease Do
MKAFTRVGLLLALAVVALSAVSVAKTSKSTSSSHGKSGVAWMGVYTQSVDKELAKAFNLKSDRGVVVNQVADDSPAEKAGLKEEDVILSANGSSIESANDLSEAVSAAKPGDKMTLDVIRSGHEMQIAVTLGEREDSSDNIIISRGYKAPQNWTFNYSNDDEEDSYIGVQLVELTPQLGAYFGADDANGVLVSEVEKGSPAEKAGIQAGDIIVAVGDDKVSDAQDLRDMIQDTKAGSSVSLGILREHNAKTIAVEVERRKEHGVVGYHFTMPKTPSIPSMKGLYLGGDDNQYFDSREFRRQMDDLRKQLETLKVELKDNDQWREDLRRLKEDLRQLQDKSR